MHLLLAALSASTTHRMMELAALLGVLSGIALAVAGWGRSFRRTGLLTGGGLLAVSFLLLVVAWHFGLLR